jgi:hypothetical protein
MRQRPAPRKAGRGAGGAPAASGHDPYPPRPQPNPARPTSAIASAGERRITPPIDHVAYRLSGRRSAAPGCCNACTLSLEAAALRFVTERSAQKNFGVAVCRFSATSRKVLRERMIRAYTAAGRVMRNEWISNRPWPFVPGPVAQRRCPNLALAAQQ